MQFGKFSFLLMGVFLIFIFVHDEAFAQTVPDRVTGLSATAISPYQIDLSWTTPGDGGSPITGYEIERKKGSDPWIVHIADTGNTNTSFSDQGLEPDTRYRYRVSAINAIGIGQASSADAARTLDITVSDRVTGLSATAISPNQIDLSWDEPYDGESPITGYQIERKKGAEDWVIYIADTGNTNTSYSDQRLDSDTVYRYKVSAINAIGTGNSSTAKSARTLDITVPDRVTGLSATAISPNQIDLSWDEPYDGESSITGYQIERRKTGDSWLIHVADTGNTSTTYSDLGLISGTEYSYRVSAINAIGMGSASTVATTTTLGPTQTEPDRVTGLSATAISPNQIDLSWDEPYDGESPITGYQIERRYASDPWVIYIADTGNNSTDYSDQGLDSDTQYRYRVSAINAIGIGLVSSSVSENTLDITVPDRVIGLNGMAVNPSQIDLSWDEPYDGESPITGYQIERRYASDPWVIYIADTGNNSTDYSDQGLDSDTRYRYRVSAINAIGIGSASSTVSITTPVTGTPSVPTNLQGSPSCCEVTLTWTAPTSDGGSPIIDYIIKYSDNNGFSWITFEDGTSTQTQATITSLQNNVVYLFSVSALNSFGEGPSSQIYEMPFGSTGTSETPVAPKIMGIGFYKIISHTNSPFLDIEECDYSEHFPYSSNSDITDKQIYGEIFEKRGYFNCLKVGNLPPTFMTETNEPVQIQVNVEGKEASSKVTHFEMHLGNELNGFTNGFDVELIWDKGQPLQVIDPKNILKNAQVNTSYENNWLWIVFDLEFSKEMDLSDIVLKTWNDHHKSAKKLVPESISVSDQIIQHYEEDVSLRHDVIIPEHSSHPTCAILDDCYLPMNAEIIEGGVITWKNIDSFIHNVVSGSKGKADNRFNFVVLPGKQVQYKFEFPGIYNYFCELHPWSVGTITVYSQEGITPEIQNDESLPVLQVTSETSKGSILLENNDNINLKNHDLNAHISGHVNQKNAKSVNIIITNPDGETEKLSASVNDSGNYFVPTKLNPYWKTGMYEVKTQFKGEEIAKISFFVAGGILK